MTALALVVLGVVLFAGFCKYLIGSLLSEVEAERLELKDGTTGRWL